MATLPNERTERLAPSSLFLCQMQISLALQANPPQPMQRSFQNPFCLGAHSFSSFHFLTQGLPHNGSRCVLPSLTLNSYRIIPPSLFSPFPFLLNVGIAFSLSPSSPACSAVCPLKCCLLLDRICCCCCSSNLL